MVAFVPSWNDPLPAGMTVEVSYLSNGNAVYSSPGLNPNQSLPSLVRQFKAKQQANSPLTPSADQDIITRDELAAALAAFTPTSAGIDENDIGYDLVLLVGQSNMAGCGSPLQPEQYDWVSERIFTYDATGPYADTVRQGKDPLYHPQGQSVFVGPGMEFARQHIRRTPANRRVLLVPASWGGTAISYGEPRWEVDGTQAQNLTTMAIEQTKRALTAAGANSRVVAILWMQGDSDAQFAYMNNENVVTFKSNFTLATDKVFNAFRTRIPTCDNTTPILLASALPEAMAVASSSGHAVYRATDEVHRETPGRVPYTAYIAGAVGNPLGDGYHYNSVGERDNGVKLYSIWPKAKANTTGIADTYPARPATPMLTVTVTNAKTLSFSATVPVNTTDMFFVVSRTGVNYATKPYIRVKAVANTGPALATLPNLLPGQSYEVYSIAYGEGGFGVPSAIQTVVTPSLPVSTIRDNFNRSNSSTVGAGQEGPAPLTSSNAVIANNQLSFPTAGDGFASWEPGTDNYYAEAKIVNIGGGLLWRSQEPSYSTGTNYRWTSDGYFCAVTNGVLSIEGVTSGFVAGDTVGVACDGSNHTFYVNGSNMGTIANTRIASGGAGVWGNPGFLVDDVYIKPGAAPSATITNVIDSFTRADSSTIGTGEQGNAPVLAQGTGAIVNNRLSVGPNGTSSVIVWNTGSGDFTGILTMTGPMGTGVGNGGPCIRTSSTGAGYRWTPGGDLYHVTSGFTVVSQVGSFKDGDVIKVVALGSTLTFFVNDVQTGQYATATTLGGGFGVWGGSFFVDNLMVTS